jgi:hypothetical protein
MPVGFPGTETRGACPFPFSSNKRVIDESAALTHQYADGDAAMPHALMRSGSLCSGVARENAGSATR